MISRDLPVTWPSGGHDKDEKEDEKNEEEKE